MPVLFGFDLTQLHLPGTVALAVVAVIGYFVGRRQRFLAAENDQHSRRELKRARAIARDLERITQEVRKSLARHHSSVARFKNRVSVLGADRSEAAWKELCREAESILGPTMQLAAHIAQAYDQIRQQSSQLMSFTEVRTDPLTGVSNRRAMDDALASLTAMKHRYEVIFSIAIVDIDHFKSVNDQRGHVAGDQVLQAVAKLMDDTARETDIVTRYGGEEFVVLMPQTELSGACVFGERIRQAIERKLSLTVSVGVAEALDSESAEDLLRRADAALYLAKSCGRNRVGRHDGKQAEPLLQPEEMVS
ncbi:MAG TPA: GGDEF domain-containing protein [Pirellulales bacterium]